MKITKAHWSYNLGPGESLDDASILETLSVNSTQGTCLNFKQNTNSMKFYEIEHIYM